MSDSPLKSLADALRGDQAAKALKAKTLLPDNIDGSAPPMPNGLLIEAMDAMDVVPDQPRDNGKYIHVSSLSQLCPRAYAIREKYGETGVGLSTVDKGQRVVWSLGRAAELHARLQLTLAFPEMAYGIWTCKCEKLRHTGVYSEAMEKQCHHCGGTLVNYEEVDLKNDDLYITGHPDLLLLRNGVEFTVVEFKSINKAGFAKRKQHNRADGEHICQALTYRETLRHRGHRVAPYVVVIYVCKDFDWGVSPYLEFRAALRGGLKASVSAMEDNAAAVVQWRNDPETLPPRISACYDNSASRAKGCGQCTLCFSLPNEQPLEPQE